MLSSPSMRKIALALAFLAAACGGGSSGDDGSSSGTTPPDETENETFATAGTDANATESDLQLLSASLLGSTGDLATADAVPFAPRSCVKMEATRPRQATYTFDGCLGPNGLRQVRGVIEASYEARTFSFTLRGASVNGATVDGTATAAIDVAGANRTMTWSADFRGTTGAGRAFTRTSSSTLRWQLGEACYQLTGASEGTVERRGVKVEVTAYERCRRGCPTGAIAVTNTANGRSVSLTYDGTNRATYVGLAGREREIALLCIP